MIQPLNSMSTNCCGTSRKQSFGDNPQSQDKPFVVENKEQLFGKKPSKAKAIAAYATAQFFAGAIISSALNLGSNLVQKLKKVPDPAKIIPLKTIAKEAALMGGIFIAMGLIVDGVFSLFNRKNHKS